MTSKLHFCKKIKTIKIAQKEILKLYVLEITIYAQFKDKSRALFGHKIVEMKFFILS